MFSTLLLAATSRCASLLLCPTDTELIDALLAHDSTVRKVAADEALRKGEIVLFHLPQAAWQIRDVSCGDREPGELPITTCEFTARYTGRDVHQIARLIQQTDNWRIIEIQPAAASRR